MARGKITRFTPQSLLAAGISAQALENAARHASHYGRYLANTPTAAQRAHAGGIARTSRSISPGNRGRSMSITSSSNRSGSRSMLRSASLSSRGGRSVRFAAGTSGGVRTSRRRRVRRNGGTPHNILNKGCYMTTERSCVQTSDNCVYVGHATNPLLQTTQIVMMAFVKAIFRDLGIKIPSMESVVDGSVAGDAIVIQYRVNREVATGLTTHTESIFGVTYFAVADALATWMGGLPEQVEFDSCYLNITPATSLFPFRSWNLLNTRIMVTSTSTLKFQNRSVNETGDEDTNDVDNVPLIGRSYSGKGTGTEWNNGTLGVKPFYADRFGLINKDGDTEGMKEPPFGQLFSQVKKSGGISIHPGSIKISKLSHKINLTLNRFHRMFDDHTYGSTYPAGSMGKFEFYGVEKVIGGLSAQEIQVALEVNLLIGAVVKLGRPTYTTSVFRATSGAVETV